MKPNNRLEKFIGDIESIKMTSYEKDEMRNHLTSFALSYTPVVSPYHHVVFLMRRGLAMAFVVILVVGSLSNVASGQALPGDTLYPVKIVHEEIKLATTFDTKKKISYEIKRTEKRIREATELATQHDLDEVTQIQIADTIKKQTNKVTERINEVKSEHPEDALVLNAELKSTIKLNAEALKHVTTTVEKQKVSDDGVQTDENEVDVVEIQDTENEVDAQQIQEDNAENTSQETTQESSPTHQEDGKYVDVSVSSAESLLESIEEEVKNIEAFEDAVSEELTKDEEEEIHQDMNTAEPTSQPSVKEQPTERVDVVKSPTEQVDVHDLENEIDSLKEILDLKKEIKKVKQKLTLQEGVYALTETFDEVAVYKNVEDLIERGKYKKAFVALQEVLTYYQEQFIVQELAFDLGITVNQKPTETVSDTETVDQNLLLQAQEKTTRE